ncbi:MAG: hypothetical protein KC443_11475, partial [Anaerolineales bacterium]|nr:hypothetical protein [Anaerolineales bacterium]
AAEMNNFCRHFPAIYEGALAVMKLPGVAHFFGHRQAGMLKNVCLVHIQVRSYQCLRAAVKVSLLN